MPPATSPPDALVRARARLGVSASPTFVARDDAAEKRSPRRDPSALTPAPTPRPSLPPPAQARLPRSLRATVDAHDRADREGASRVARAGASRRHPAAVATRLGFDDTARGSRPRARPRVAHARADRPDAPLELFVRGRAPIASLDTRAERPRGAVVTRRLPGTRPETRRPDPRVRKPEPPNGRHISGVDVPVPRGDGNKRGGWKENHVPGDDVSIPGDDVSVPGDDVPDVPVPAASIADAASEDRPAASSSPPPSASLRGGERLWRTVRRARETHAIFLEASDASRDAAWTALMLSGVGESRNRRAPPDVFASTARRLVARHSDARRVVRDLPLAIDRLGRAQARSRHFRGFDPVEVEAIAREFELVRYDAGETVVAAGDDADFAALVVEGFARVDVVDSTGARRSIGTFGPGALIGEMALWEGGVRSADVVAAGSDAEPRRDEKKKSHASSTPTTLGFLDGDADGTKPAGFASRGSNSRTLAVRFHFETLASFFERRPKTATRLFRVFARSSSSRLREWRLRVAADRTRNANAAATPTTPPARVLDLLRLARADADSNPIPERESSAESGGVSGRTASVDPSLRFLRSLSDDHLAAFARLARVVRCAPRSRVPAFATGDPASSLGVVLEGAVRVGDGSVRGPGAVFAAEDFVRAFGPPVQRRWNATATDEGVLVAALDATHAARLDEIRPGAAAAVMRAAADAACAGGNNATETIERKDDEGEGEDEGDGDGEFLSAPSAVRFAHPDEPELCFPPETQIRRLALADAFEHHSAAASSSSPSSMESVVGFLREAFDARDGPRGDDERSSNLAGIDASLASLSDDEVRRFARRCAALEVAAGRQIVRPGRRREFFGILAKGAATVVSAEGAIVAELAPGAWIGEAGYVTGDEPSRSGTRRDAAVVSAVDGTVVIAASIFAAREMERDDPALAFKIAASCARSACARAMENRDRHVPEETFDEEGETTVGPKGQRARREDETGARFPRASAVADDDEDGDGDGDVYGDGDVVIEDPDDDVEAKEDEDETAAGEGGRDERREGDARGVASDEVVNAVAASLLRDAHVGSPDGGAFEGDARDDDFAALATICVVRSFPPGARVFTRGAAATASLFLLAGALEHVEDEPSRGTASESSSSLSSSSSSRSKRRRAGQWAGETPYLEFGDDDADVGGVGGADANRRRRPSDARADPREGCVAAVFSHASLDRLAEEKPALAMAVLSRMAAAATARRRRALADVLGEDVPRVRRK